MAAYGPLTSHNTLENEIILEGSSSWTLQVQVF